MWVTCISMNLDDDLFHHLFICFFFSFFTFFIFISPWKHMLWVLIRSTEVLLMSTHNICFCTEIRNAHPDTTLLYSFGKRGVTGSDLAYYFIFFIWVLFDINMLHLTQQFALNMKFSHILCILILLLQRYYQLLMKSDQFWWRQFSTYLITQEEINPNMVYLALKHMTGYDCIYSKYMDTSLPYHTCSKLWTSLVYCQLTYLRTAGWVATL